jgi:hypothetical protein
VKLKQYARYQIDFLGKWVTAAGGLMGLSIFLRIVHFFGIHLITDFDASFIVMRLAIPVVLSAFFIFLLNGIHWNAPGIYGIMGAIFCLLLLIWNFSTGNILRIIVSTIWFLAAAVVILATTGGYVPGTLLAFLFFAIPLGFRIFLYDYPLPAITDLFMEFADLCIIASLTLFPLVLVPGRKRDSEPAEHDPERKR